MQNMRLLVSTLALALFIGGCSLTGNDDPPQITNQRAIIESLGSIYIVQLENQSNTEYFTYTLPEAYQQDSLRVTVSGEIIPTRTDLPLDKVRKTLKVTEIDSINANE